jgi:predicted lipoprotein
MKRTWISFCCLLLLGYLFWCFPLFHVVRIDQLENPQHESAFSAAEFAKTFWSGQLTPSLNQAPDAVMLLADLRASPKAARAKFGRKVGVSRTRLVVLRGKGTIVTIDKKGVGVALRGETKEADIVLQTGLLFGNTVRDATGLLDASNYPDSRQFNEISTELNRIVEARVAPILKEKAIVGRQIHFAGCAEIADEGELVKPLTIIPLDVRVEEK